MRNSDLLYLVKRSVQHLWCQTAWTSLRDEPLLLASSGKLALSGAFYVHHVIIHHRALFSGSVFHVSILRISEEVYMRCWFLYHLIVSAFLVNIITVHLMTAVQ